MLIKCVIKITESFKIAHDFCLIFLIFIAWFKSLI